MDLIFYKSGPNELELFFMLKLLLIKGLKNNLRFNIFFPQIEEYHSFSAYLWNSSNILPHGFVEDGYYNLQPIILCKQSEYIESSMKKDIAIIIKNDLNESLAISSWQKVFFINCSSEIFQKYKLLHNVQCWEYNANQWRALDNI